ALLLLTLLLATTGLAAQRPADLTILYYSAADNDLEGFMIGDLMEMHLVGSTDQVNIVLQMDRHPAFDQVNGDWTDTRRYLVTRSANGLSGGDFTISRAAFIQQILQLDPAQFGLSPAEFDAEVRALSNASQAEIEQIVLGLGAPAGGGQSAIGIDLTALSDLGEVTTSDPAALVDFATWGIATYPAERYMLILSNHGGGWQGVAYDETSANDSLSMSELDTALAEIIARSGIGQFELVAFDACLMAQLEVFATIAPYARYSIASQEVIPGAGWEYVTPLTALTARPQMSMDDFGRRVVDGYMQYYTRDLQGYTAFDLHLVDLSRIDGVIAAVDGLASAVQAHPDSSLLPIGRARDNAQAFSVSDPDAARVFSSVDLLDFARLLADLAPDAAVQQAARQVMAAVQAAVVYGAASPELPGSHGIAIYFPANENDYALAGTTYPQQGGAKLPGWQDFLATFYGTATQTFPAGDLSITINEVLPADGTASIYDPPVVLFTTNGSGIVDLQFFAALTLEDGRAILLDASRLEFTVTTPEGNVITEYPQGESLNEFAWNVEMPVMTDAAGNSEITVFITSPDDPTVATVGGLYRWRDGSESRAYLVVDLETQAVQSVFGLQAADGSQAVGEIRPRTGDTFEPYYRFVGENGDLEVSPSGTELVFSDAPFTFEFVPAATGSYVFTMWVQDIAGNISLDSVNFAVNNDDLDPAYRGFKDLGMGLNFLFPWGWSNPNVTLNADDSYTLDVSSPDGAITVLVDTYGPAYGVQSLDDIITIATDTLTNFGAEFDPPEATLLETFGGDYDGYLLYYGYTTADDAARLGAQIVLYVPENATGYIIDVDTAADRQAEAAQVLNDIISSMFFFPPR
ncbi:MAG: clostripain-related cysteine peptidase, partial [Anaerolineae bacterium]|nr:clostripain-related cysteine peptidase [Anaerolineae bacterium]